MKWVGTEKQQTWDPEYNVPKAMIDEFERGEQGTSTYFNIVEKKFGITTVTNLKAEGTHEKTAKRLKTDDIQEKKR